MLKSTPMINAMILICCLFTIPVVTAFAIDTPAAVPTPVIYMGTEGNDSQIHVGTASDEMILQIGLGGNDTQYATGLAGNDYIYQDGADGNNSQTARGGAGDDQIFQYEGAGNGKIIAYVMRERI
jgi:Ca2+-binding RTX toxin-like protein